MLPRPHRLTNSADIVAVVRTGMKIETPYVRVYSLPGKDAVRIACVVGKKVHAKAHVRHRYQRWLRAWISELLPSVSVPTDIVLVAKPAITSVTTMAILKDSLQSVIPSVLSQRHA